MTTISFFAALFIKASSALIIRAFVAWLFFKVSISFSAKRFFLRADLMYLTSLREAIGGQPLLAGYSPIATIKASFFWEEAVIVRKSPVKKINSRIRWF